jgi:hypothetical protein
VLRVAPRYLRATMTGPDQNHGFIPTLTMVRSDALGYICTVERSMIESHPRNRDIR